MKYYLHPEIEANEKLQKIIGRACSYHNQDRDLINEGFDVPDESIEWYLIHAVNNICDEFDNKWNYLLESTYCIYGVDD